MPSLPFERILADRPDPLDILSSTAPVVKKARLVRIDIESLNRAADLLIRNKVHPPAWDYNRHYFDETARSVTYVFLLDSLNFSFWGQPRWRVEYRGKMLDGYWALAAAVKQAAEQYPELLDAGFLARITPKELGGVLHGKGVIPLFVQRWRNVRELGKGLVAHWEGQATRLVEYAKKDAGRLARLIVENFSSFDDSTIYDEDAVRFFKRAQILVTDLWGSFQGRGWGEFDNIGVLTAFADYKLPQILRAWRVLHYAAPLARRIDQKRLFAPDSPEEVEIRAATLWAVEFLRDALAERGTELPSAQVDWILWNASQQRAQRFKPYHRVRTIYY